MVSGQLKALLGVLAVAGYQNRDKIAEVLRGLQRPQPAGANPGANTGARTSGNEGAHGGPETARQPGGLDDILGRLSGAGGLGSLIGGLTSGGILSGGLGDLLKTFQQNGQGQKAESWVKPGTNEDIDDDQLAQAIGPDVLDELAAKTGLSRADILSRLSKDLPRAVDDLTPDGRVPDEGGSTV